MRSLASLAFSLALFWVVALSSTRATKHMNLQFYMHDTPFSSKPSAIPVAAARGNFSDVGFGLTFIIDDDLTQGPDPKSTRVGRGQGFYSLASQTGIDLLLVFTATMETPEHNGSTICLHGSDKIGLFEREIAVVGGTGHFRFARGYAIIQTASLTQSVNVVLKFNITMRF